MNVSVVLCTYNRASLLKETLDALARQRTGAGLEWELVVVDNNSTDATRRTVEAFSAEQPIAVRYVFEPRQGLSFARNKGLETANGSIIAFTDDDVLPEADWIAKLAALMSDWNADAIGGRILPRWDVAPPQWLSRSARLRRWITLMESQSRSLLTWPPQGDAEVWGANMSFRRSFFEDVGYFDTTLGPVGGKYFRGEDVEIIRKGLERGKRIAYDPTLTVLHRVLPERTRRAYFRKFAFDLGEGEGARWNGGAEPRWLGVPRWMYRASAAQLTRFAFEAVCARGDAFERELDFLRELGRLKGCYLRSRSELARRDIGSAL